MTSLPPTPPALAGGLLTIDLEALKANYITLAKKSGKAECGAAVKADAYGIGVEEAAKTLWDAGCRTYFVARPTEGEQLRRILPHTGKTRPVIYVLDGLHQGQAEYYATHDLRPALTAMDEIREWSAFARRWGHALPCAIHVDTGINRLGLSLADYQAAVSDHDLMKGLNQ
jgi:alanine racemase